MLFGSRIKERASDPVATGDRGQDALLRKEAEIGRRFALDHVYYHFDDPWPTARQTWDQAAGRTPFINWKPEEPVLRWAVIAAGEADSLIDARAMAAKAFGSPIYLAFHHEPENDTATYGTPAEYRAAWQRIRFRFDTMGVTNVRFVMVLGADAFDGAGGADAWYPGPAVVGFVGADGYNWYPAKKGTRWREASAIFANFVKWSQARKVPAFIAETGCQEDPADPSRKAEWFTNARAWLKGTPAIVAFMYFDSDRIYPWWTDSSSSSLEAYAAMAKDPAFA